MKNGLRVTINFYEKNSFLHTGIKFFADATFEGLWIVFLNWVTKIGSMLSSVWVFFVISREEKRHKFMLKRSKFSFLSVDI